MTERSGGGSRGRRKKFLTVEQKYELWTALVPGGTRPSGSWQTAWGVDRTTVAKVAQVAKHGALSALEASKPGRPGAVDPQQQELREAREEIARLTEAVEEQAIELALLRGKQRGAW